MPLFTFGVQLCWPHECSDCRKSDVMLNGHTTAEQWLAQISQDPLAMISLHEVCREYCSDRLNRLDDQAVIRAVAAQIASGLWKACDQNWPAPRSVDVPNDDAPPASNPIPVARSKPAPPPPAAIDPSTFPANLNVLAQAHALASAAAQGVPFCPE